MRSLTKRSGFTLIELMVYTAVFVVTAGLLTGILITISGSQSRENAAFEVTRQLQFVTQKIQYSVRDASNIVSAYEGSVKTNPCVNFCTLEILVRNKIQNPDLSYSNTVKFSSDANGVYMTEGSNPKVLLTTPSVTVSSLKFSTVPNPGGISTVTIDLNLAYSSNEARLAVTKRLTSAIAHVSAATFDSDLLPDTSGGRNIGSSASPWGQAIVTNGFAANVNSAGSAASNDYTVFTALNGSGDATSNGAAFGASTFSQYYTVAAPYNKFGTHINVGTTPILYLEGDLSQTTRRAYFMSSNVGIGLANPIYKLQVAGVESSDANNVKTGSLFGVTEASAETHGIYLRLKGNNAGISGLTYANQIFSSGGNAMEVYGGGPLVFGTANTERVRIDASGNVGIGNTPSYKLDVTGDLRITGTPYRTGGDIAWQVPSDARLKNISGAYDRGLKAIMSLHPVRYFFKNDTKLGLDSSKEYIGIIAQEAQKVVPEAVSMEKNGYLSLNTTPIFWTIINAIKDLSNRDDETAKIIASQNETIKALTHRIEVLEKNSKK